MPARRGTRRDERVRAAMERGKFTTGLPGRGRPLPGIDEPFDDLWWVKRWREREGLAGGAARRELDASVRSPRAQREAEAGGDAAGG